MTLSPESSGPSTRRARRERTQDSSPSELNTAASQPGAASPPDVAQRDDLSSALFATAPMTLSGGDAASPEPEAAPAPEPAQVWTDEQNPPTALTWLDADALTTAAPAHQSAPDLFAGAHLIPGWLRPRILVPLGIVAALCGSYVGTTLVWPLTSVAPSVQAVQVEIAPAPPAVATWPTEGSAAVGIQGLSTMASASERAPIASISKVVSVLMVLDELPLQIGEQGPSFEFTWQDSRDFWSYRRSNQSSLDVPVGGSLTEYQMLQGILLGSANNYIDRLSDEIWGSDRAFAEAAEQWLSERGIDGITLKSPSGFDDENVATPEALVKLGELAMKNPVFAEIVGTRSVELPVAGLVSNTNSMLDDAGVVGIKTGTLRGDWNLLTAKDLTIDDTTVRVFTAVLGQEDDPARLAVTRSLLDEVQQSLAAQPVSVPKGTVVGHVETEWGDRVDIVTDADARVVLWNGAGATASTAYDLGEKTEAGAAVGSLTAQGPLDEAKTTVSLADEITKPSIWWRLTHPMELFGLDKS